MGKVMQKGRQQIFTDYDYVDDTNIIEILQDAMSTHRLNSADCDFLLDFEAGIQPILRRKVHRPEINAQVVDNVASEIVDFKLGFQWGNPVTFVQREGDKNDIAQTVMQLNDCYSLTGNAADTQKLARFVEICGIGYTYIDINREYEDGDSYFTRDVLDPRNALMIKSRAYTDHRNILAVTFRKDKKSTTYYTCFTKSYRYDLDDSTGGLKITRIELNPLGKIPIIEWVRQTDRTGCFERQIDEMNNLNLLVSDFTNSVEQNVQAVWHANDVDFPTEEVEVTVLDANGKETTQTIEQIKRPSNGDWLSTYTSPDGKTPFITPLCSEYGQSGSELENIAVRRNLILQKCHVPRDNEVTGSTSGLAMGYASGWADAEQVAQAQDCVVLGCQMEELRVVLSAIKESPDIDINNPLMNLSVKDVEAVVRRPKSAEMSLKTASIATLLNVGFSLEDTVNAIPLFADNSQVIKRSGDSVKAYQDSKINSTDTTESEYENIGGDNAIDQADNSPLVDGIGTNDNGLR